MVLCPEPHLGGGGPSEQAMLAQEAGYACSGNSQLVPNGLYQEFLDYTLHTLMFSFYEAFARFKLFEHVYYIVMRKAIKIYSFSFFFIFSACIAFTIDCRTVNHCVKINISSLEKKIKELMKETELFQYYITFVVCCILPVSKVCRH